MLPIEWLIIGWLYVVGVWVVLGITRHANPYAEPKYVWASALFWPVLLPAERLRRSIKKD